MIHHVVHADLLQDKVHVVLVGAGGNGAQMLTCLARLHLAMKALGHPGGLDVIALDPDNVSEANVGRQLFSRADVGLPKVCVLMHRLNCFYGLNWEAAPVRYRGPKQEGLAPNITDLLITCVDTARARREIHRQIIRKAHATPKYWLDLGNRQFDGQVILGQPDPGTIIVDNGKTHKEKKPQSRLPTVVEVFPELLDETIPEEDTPSCSLAEALEKQSLFINDHVCRWAMTLLETMFRTGKLVHHGYFVNLMDGRANPLIIKKATEVRS